MASESSTSLTSMTKISHAQERASSNGGKVRKMTDEQLKMIRAGINRTWSAIYYDALSLIEREPTVDEAVELCLDAGRLEEFGHLSMTSRMKRAEWTSLCEEFRKLSYEEQEDVAAKALR